MYTHTHTHTHTHTQTHTCVRTLACTCTQIRVGGTQKVVCQKAFASRHCVSLSHVQRIAIATCSSSVAPMDMRGRYSNRPSKISPAVKKEVKEHIKDFPIIIHRLNKRRRYISPLLSIAEMHRLYVAKHEGGVATPRVKYS